MKKLKINNVKTVLVNGRLGITTELDSYMTLEEIRVLMKNGIDKMIDGLINSTKNHICTHGVVVYPLIHIVHDDENENNIVYQEILKSEKN